MVSVVAEGVLLVAAEPGAVVEPVALVGGLASVVPVESVEPVWADDAPDPVPAEALPDVCVEATDEASTTTVPFMNGWIAQMYANVPGLANVCEALWPFFSVPVLKLPLVAVAVWSVGPLLVQVTVSPTWIVSVPGVNLKSEILSGGSPAAARVLAFACTRLAPLALPSGNLSSQDLPLAVRPVCLAGTA